jgi:GH35 family endo-1,4-beta-xylanase
VQNITDPNDLKNVMKTHIDAVMGRYGSRLAHMDVVNEREWRPQGRLRIPLLAVLMTPLTA